jgi:formylglycine-generating enzyme
MKNASKVFGIAIIMAMLLTGCPPTPDNDGGDNPTTPDNGGGNNPMVEMVKVAGGAFQMGDVKNEGDNWEKPLHTVTLSNFSIGKYPVTQAQYQAVMGSNPSEFNGTAGKEPASGEAQGKRPVEKVSWYDAIVFCNKLSKLEGLSPAYSISGSTDPATWGAVPTTTNATWNAAVIVAGANGYRLPTEAQWEYAAKGGNPSASGWAGYTYSGSDTVDDVAWYGENSGSMTHEVGKKAPNRLGLYDMSGNVFEWCWDWYAAYSSDAQTDPTGAVSGSYRVRRGGCGFSSAGNARSAFRVIDDPSVRYGNSGFRLARP